MNASREDSIPTGSITTSTPEETFQLGARMGAELKGGEVLLVDGPLGAGKTLFAQGLASALGIDPHEVNSPSFTLVNVHRGRVPFYHLDLYRLDGGEAAARAVGLDELLEDARAVLLIEWGARLGPYPFLEVPVYRIRIEGDGQDPRVFSISRTTSPAV